MAFYAEPSLCGGRYRNCVSVEQENTEIVGSGRGFSQFGNFSLSAPTDKETLKQLNEEL